MLLLYQMHDDLVFSFELFQSRKIKHSCKHIHKKLPQPFKWAVPHDKFWWHRSNLYANTVILVPNVINCFQSELLQFSWCKVKQAIVSQNPRKNSVRNNALSTLDILCRSTNLLSQSEDTKMQSETFLAVAKMFVFAFLFVLEPGLFSTEVFGNCPKCSTLIFHFS